MNHTPHDTRRGFLRRSTLAAAALTAPRLAAADAPAPLFSALGLAAGLDKAAALKQAGAQFLTLGTDAFLAPAEPEAVFEKNLARLREGPLPALACNGFIRPPELRCVGADATPDQVLAWAEKVFQRAGRAGIQFVVFGSSGARRLNDGWSREKADAQFVALLKRMGPRAEAAGVTLTIEQLNSGECNYITRLAEGAAIVRAVGHPRIRMLADLYHMARMGDGPAELEAAMDTVVHVEIAEEKERTVPGVKGDDFRPWFRVLRKAGYHGAVSIEGRWDDTGQIERAFAEIKRQAAEA